MGACAPVQVLPELATKVGAGRVFCHAEVSFEESAAEARVAAALKSHDIALKAHWDSTLHRPGELPFKIEDMPATHGVLWHLSKTFHACKRY